MKRLAASGLALILLAGCKVHRASEQPAVTTEEAIRIAEAAEANFTTGDVNKVMAQYAPGAVMFDAGSPAFSTDRKVQTGWAQSFVSMKPADYHVPDRQIQILGPDAFISSGTEMFTVAAGAARPTLTFRFTDVFQRQRDGSWKIVHEHLSSPPAAAPK
ncbi:MAG TPA: nuclear transport factor 2 family protein [Sphingomicrobium sp.]|nr:nuclear transport factor 2 family protein [Sphingomicrobium sp.]